MAYNFGQAIFRQKFALEDVRNLSNGKVVGFQFEDTGRNILLHSHCSNESLFLRLKWCRRRPRYINKSRVNPHARLLHHHGLTVGRLEIVG